MKNLLMIVSIAAFFGVTGAAFANSAACVQAIQDVANAGRLSGKLNQTVEMDDVFIPMFEKGGANPQFLEQMKKAHTDLKARVLRVEKAEKKAISNALEKCK